MWKIWLFCQKNKKDIFMDTFYKKMRIISILGIFILFNNANCSKKETEPVYYISDELKSYVIFNKGSFWIYQNQNGIKDTVSITNLNQVIIDNPHGQPFEKIFITKSSTITGSEKFFSMCNYDRYCFYSSSISTPYSFFCCCEPNTKYSGLTYKGVVDLTIHNDYFPEALYFVSDSTHTKSLKDLYYAKNIGLIKYNDYENNEWDLIKYIINENNY